jgi:hypothetical protein
MKNVTKWVQGNTLPLAVKLYEIVAIDGGFKRQAYEAPAGSIYAARIVGKRTYNYECEVSGNVVTFVDDGTLPCGYYGVEVTVKEPERNLRTFKCMQLEIVSCSCEMNLGEFLSPDALAADSDVFFWAKGDKGDPLTYDDLTEEQKADLRQGCYEKVPNIGISEDEGVTQVKSDETFPVAHPDMSSTEAKLLPQTFLGHKVYEKVFQTQSSSFTINLGSADYAIIEAHCFHDNGQGDGRYKYVELQHIGIGWWSIDKSSYNIEIGDYLIVKYTDMSN